MGDIPNEYKENSSIIDYNLFDVHETESVYILNFSGVDLCGYSDKKREFGTNNISFEFSKKDNVLNFYHVKLYTNDKISKLIEALYRKAKLYKYA